MIFKILLILPCFFLTTFLIKGTMTQDSDSGIVDLYSGHYFDPLAKRNQVTYLGHKAILPCPVRQLGSNTVVSWFRVRVKDFKLLTSGRHIYIRDNRIESYFSEETETWNLIIGNVQERDAGIYECAVFTTPVMNLRLSLRVLVPKVTIQPMELYMQEGSTVWIDCHISNVFGFFNYYSHMWFKGDKRIIFNKEKELHNQIRMESDEDNMNVTSTLLIPNARAEASGNYTCTATDLQSASIMLHVINAIPKRTLLDH